MLWKIAPTSLMKRDLLPPSPWDQRRRPGWNQRVINLLNSLPSPREIHLVHAAAILEIYLPYRVVPLWGKHRRCNTSRRSLDNSRPFSFTILEINALAIQRSLDSHHPMDGRGWSYILMGNHVGISIPTIWWAGSCRLKQMQMNTGCLLPHYYFLNDYWSGVVCVLSHTFPIVVNETCEQI